MALPMLLGGVVKGVAGGAAKKAISGGSQKTKGAKKFVSGKSAIVKQQKEGIVKKTDVIPQRQTKFISLPSSVYKVPETKSEKDVSPDTLKKQLDNIDKTTRSLILIGKTENENLESLAQSAEEESDKRLRERLENKLEQGKKKTSRGASFISPKGEFDPLGFLTNILLGGAALGLLDLINGIIPQLNKANTDGDKNLGLLKNFLVGASLLVKPVKNTLKGFARRIGGVGNVLKTSFGKIVQGVKSTFSAIGNGISNLVKKALGIRTPAPTGVGAVGSTASGPNQFRTPRGRTPSTFNLEQARRSAPRPQGTVRPGSIAARTRQLGASMQTGTAFGGRAAGLQRGLYRAPQAASRMAGRVAQGTRAAFAVGRKVLSRVPILGSLLVGIFTYIETGRIDQALFRAGGAAIGGALGSFIPFLGTIIGTFAGEYIGDLFFIGLRGGGLDAVGKKLKQDFMAALEGGKIALDWIGGLLSKAKDAAINFVTGVFTRFYEALPKLEIPGWVPGLGGTEIINPAAFANPLTLPQALLKAFTNPESKEKGPVEKPEKEDQAPTPATPSRPMTEQEFYNAAVEDHSLPETYDAYLAQEQGTQETPQVNALSGSTGLTNIVDTGNFEGVGRGTGPVGYTSGRGMRLNPVSGQYKHHAGVDIGTSGQKGWYVALALTGKVTAVGTYGGYGKTVIITSGGKDFLFAHLARITVSQGQQYNGELIGEIGNTGAGTGEHLHFEVSPAGQGGYGKDEDPMPYVKYLRIGKPDQSEGSVETTQLVVPPQASPSRETSQSIQRHTSYTPGPGQSSVVPVPVPGQPTPQVSGGGGAPMGGIGPSTKEVVNSYYKSQLLGFLYKQG